MKRTVVKSVMERKHLKELVEDSSCTMMRGYSDKSLIASFIMTACDIMKIHHNVDFTPEEKFEIENKVIFRFENNLL